MRFSVGQSSLITALNTVSKACSVSSSLPILMGIHIKAMDGLVEFEATDLNTSIRSTIPALVEVPGEIVVSGKVFQDIVKSLPDAAVSIELVNSTLLINCERSSFKVNTLDPVDFPSFPVFQESESVQLPTKLLTDLVNRVRRAAATDKTRAILTGILLSIENNTIKLVSTDSYRLAIAEAHSETSSLEGSLEVIVPAASFTEALSIAGSGVEDFKLSLSENQLMFTIGETVYITRRIEGNFPNYKQLLPKDKATSIEIPLGDLTNALRRVAVMAQKTTPVRFAVSAEDNLVTLMSRSPDQGGAQEEVVAEVEGEDMEIAFNHHYVLDGLSMKADADEKVMIELQSALKPGIFRMFGSVDYLYLVMPVRMN